MSYSMKMLASSQFPSLTQLLTFLLQLAVRGGGKSLDTREAESGVGVWYVVEESSQGRKKVGQVK